MKEAADEGAVQLPARLCSELHVHSGMNLSGISYQPLLSCDALPTALFKTSGCCQSPVSRCSAEKHVSVNPETQAAGKVLAHPHLFRFSNPTRLNLQRNISAVRSTTVVGSLQRGQAGKKQDESHSQTDFKWTKEKKKKSKSNIKLWLKLSTVNIHDSSQIKFLLQLLSKRYNSGLKGTVRPFCYSPTSGVQSAKFRSPQTFPKRHAKTPSQRSPRQLEWPNQTSP